MKVGHFQCECEPGDFDANLATVIRGLEHAQREGVRIISMPESLLTGYYADETRARENSFAIDSPQVARVLSETARFGDITFMVGFNETRGRDLYNTVLVAEAGKLLGTYSKAVPCFAYFTPGREFPVFKKDGVTFGVLICADGGYVEPARILAFKGAQLIFAPHYNYVGADFAIRHFTFVRSDHTARAVENGVWFLRGNNVNTKRDAGLDREGVGYGDSYLVDPHGEIIARSVRHEECFVIADIHMNQPAQQYYRDRATNSAKALGGLLAEAVDQAPGLEDSRFC